jgi:hypothetical protein
MSSAQDYKRLALQLRQAIDRYQFSEPIHGEEHLLQLPSYPKVEVLDDEIIIIGEDGDREIWDTEEDEIKAIAIASNLELELRAIMYVKFHLAAYLSKLSSDLKEFNVLETNIDDILYEGYKSLSNWFIELERIE